MKRTRTVESVKFWDWNLGFNIVMQPTISTTNNVKWKIIFKKYKIKQINQISQYIMQSCFVRALEMKNFYFANYWNNKLKNQLQPSHNCI